MDRVEPQDGTGYRGLCILGALLCAIIGAAGGFGPKWIAYRASQPLEVDHSSEHLEPRQFPLTAPPPLPMPPAIRQLLASVPVSNHATPVVNRRDNVLIQKLEQIADDQVGEVPVPAAVMQLIETGRPMTAVAIRDAIGTLPLPERLECWAAIISNARLEEFPAVLHRAWVEPLDESTSQMLVNMIARKWARLDPVAAFEAFRLPLPSHFYVEETGLDIVAREWFKVDEAAVLDTVEKIVIERQRHRLLALLLPEATDKVDAFERAWRSARDGETFGVIAHALAESQPLDLLRIAAEDPSRISGGLVALALGSLAQNDPEEAASRLERMPPGRERWLAMHAVAKGWAASLPEAALAWARSDATGEYSLEIQARVLRYWIETNPGAASREVEAHPHYTQRLQLLYHLGQIWGASDAVAAQQWIETKLIGAAQECALCGFLQEKYLTGTNGGS
ncbi:MAG: hypothetical protein O3C21_05620, partial [Verrucomicrobia bacterium]|nr:hypothetical protein [Verrucomicrobiota bacterium]